MDLGKFSLTWFDLLVLGLIAFGIWRGRKRGMSEELLDVFQWLCIVVLGALTYRSFGQLIASAVKFPPFYANITAYAAIALIIKTVFGVLKRAAGEKLVQSDAFGSYEYYL